MKKSYFICLLCASTMLAFSAWAAMETDLSDQRNTEIMDGESGYGTSREELETGSLGDGGAGGFSNNEEVEATDCELYGINCPELVTDPVVPPVPGKLVPMDPNEKACYNASCKVEDTSGAGILYVSLDAGGYVAVGCADGYAKKTDSNGCITSCKLVAADPTLPAVTCLTLSGVCSSPDVADAKGVVGMAGGFGYPIAYAYQDNDTYCYDLDCPSGHTCTEIICPTGTTTCPILNRCPTAANCSATTGGKYTITSCQPQYKPVYDRDDTRKCIIGCERAIVGSALSELKLDESL